MEPPMRPTTTTTRCSFGIAAAAPDAARRSLDMNRRRSHELARSTRRYDEHFGAAEGTDTRLKCADGVQLCAHSQMLACWSPALRDMIGAFPSSSMVESVHGPTYVFALDDASEPWIAVLNTMYPLTQPQELSWELLEATIKLAHKYGMAGAVSRLAASLLDGRRMLSLEAGQPNSVLRWLCVAQAVQSDELGSALLDWLRPLLPVLARRRHTFAKFMASARECADRELLLLLLEASVDAAGAAAGGGGRPSINSRASITADDLPPLGAGASAALYRSGAAAQAMSQQMQMQQLPAGSGGSGDSEPECCPTQPCNVAGCTACGRVALAYGSAFYGGAPVAHAAPAPVPAFNFAAPTPRACPQQQYQQQQQPASCGMMMQLDGNGALLRQLGMQQ